MFGLTILEIPWFCMISMHSMSMPKRMFIDLQAVVSMHESSVEEHEVSGPYYSGLRSGFSYLSFEKCSVYKD